MLKHSNNDYCTGPWKTNHHIDIITTMNDFGGEEKKSLHYGEAEGFTPPGVEQFTVHKDTALGGGASKGVEIRTATEHTERDESATLAAVQAELHDLGEEVTEPSVRENTLPTADPHEPPQNTGREQDEKPGISKKILTGMQQKGANLVFTFLGDRTPQFIKNHVPVYRAVHRKHAGLPNRTGTSQWTIGSEGKKHAYTWVENHKPNPHDPQTAHLMDGPEFVAIKSTWGELQRHGKAKVTHYGDYGSAHKKVVLEHTDPEKRIKHTVIKSNKEK